MNQISTAGRYYLGFCLATCGYFSAAAVGNWPNPLAGMNSGGSSYTSGSSGTHLYSSGSYSGRSSGGFGGGGK